ncbi:hypothetical protein QZH41_015747 [Actinostola sp. cb2023]|nr:hypothetical protein QZH41_015747 [Actinostola sp. cb2023]
MTADPVFWSSHMMLGFDTTIELPRLRHKLFNQLLDREVKGVVPSRFCVKMCDTQDSKAKADKLREFLTSLMLQHGSLPTILPALRDVIELANSMLAAYEEGQNLDQITMSTHLSSNILDAPFSTPLLLFLGFSFQSDGAKDKDPYVLFPHWGYDNLLSVSAVVFHGVCSIFDISGMAGHSLARLLKTVTHSNMERLKELLAITTKYPTRIVKTSDFMVRSLWCNSDVQRFLVAAGFYEVGQSLLFNKSDDNQTIVKGALRVVSALLGHIETGSSRFRLPIREVGLTTQSPSLPVIAPSHTFAVPDTHRRLRVKVVGGLTPSCNRRLAEEEPKMTLNEARERRNAIYRIYGQRYDDIAMRKRDEIRQLFVSFTEESK